MPTTHVTELTALITLVSFIAVLCVRESLNEMLAGRHYEFWTDLGKLGDADFTEEEIWDELKGKPVRGMWFRGSTPPGVANSQSAFELEMRCVMMCTLCIMPGAPSAPCLVP